MLWDFADRHLPQCRLDNKTNPTRRRRRSYRAQPRLAWPTNVQKRFLEGASPELKLAFALLLYTGQRRGDVYRMKWSHFDGKFIVVEAQEKTGEHVPIRVHRDLAAVLMRTERRGDAILTTKSGKPFDKTALTKAIKKRLREIDGESFTLHGLRKAAGVRLAEAGRDRSTDHDGAWAQDGDDGALLLPRGEQATAERRRDGAVGACGVAPAR